MGTTDIEHAVVWEDSGATCLSRVVGNDGAAVTQASLTALTYKVFDENSATPGTAATSGTLTISEVIYDTLQTGDLWESTDDTGYNFKWQVPASVLTTGGHLYRVEFWYDPVSGEDFPDVFFLLAKRLRSS